MISVLICSSSGFSIAYYSSGGIIAAFGFGVIAVLTFVSNVFAFVSIKNRKIKEHQKWMMRNYSLIFAAVTLRIWLPTALLFGATIEQALMIISWVSWIPNLLGMEIYIRNQNDGKMKVKPTQDDSYLLQNA